MFELIEMWEQANNQMCVLREQCEATYWALQGYEWKKQLVHRLLLNNSTSLTTAARIKAYFKPSLHPTPSPQPVVAWQLQVQLERSQVPPHNKALFTLTNLVPNCSCSWRRMSGNVIKFFVKFLSGSLSYNQYSDFTVLTSAGSCIYCDSVFNMQKFTWNSLVSQLSDIFPGIKNKTQHTCIWRDAATTVL